MKIKEPKNLQRVLLHARKANFGHWVAWGIAANKLGPK
jgi:hypothetical protein